MEKFLKILSALPFFLVFFGVYGYLTYSSNFDKKMKELDNKIFSECLKEFGRRDSEEEYLDYLEDSVFPCKNKKRGRIRITWKMIEIGR